ncbi:YqeB family protein [Brevibacterium album]|uniref:YqeB family protein n=1 Tax=Brevibacterium album TaxID=417948 RepID=UPI00048BFEDD|nr:hypothetical protein [Brevibacterium album]
MSDATVVKLPGSWVTGFALTGAAVGLGAAFVVRPVLGWLLGLVGDAPAPLRLAALLPLPWAIGVLTLAGLVGGWLIASIWGEGLGEVEVRADGVAVRRKGGNRFVPRAGIAEAYADKDELVLADPEGRELLRTPTDSMLHARLGAALTAQGIAWRGARDPREAEYREWVEGDGALDPEAEKLLRTRAYALQDKRKGAAAEAREALLGRGVVVRDRDGDQQYRRVPPPEGD